MAHPDHDQVIGRLVGARLRGTADRRAVSGAAEAHPDAETWAAYVDGGLRADEVARLETHLAGCPACRRLLAVLMPEVSSGAAPAVREAEAPASARGVVLPFPRRQVFVWMAAAAGLLMAVTLWSVSRLGDRPATSVAMSAPAAGAEAPAAASPVPAPADSATRMTIPLSRLEDRKAIDQAVRQEQDKTKLDARSDALARQVAAEMAARSVVRDAGAGAGAAPGAAAGRFAEPAKPAEAKQTAQAAAPVVNVRDIQQTNAATAGARPRGPLVNQQANQQAGNQRRIAATAAPAPPSPPPLAAPLPAPMPATPVAGAASAPAPPVQAEAAVARERRANEQVAEAVTTTSRPAASVAKAPEPARSQAPGADRESQFQSKDEAATPSALGYAASAVALPSFAEPGGRLRWRIADGRRLESSSDGGTTWKPRYTARGDRLRAGTAPAIDSAWAVGERGLVLRFAVPGDWTAVSRPGSAALVAVTATGAQSARVTAADGTVFETADGGATWTPAAPGAGRQ